MEYIETHKCNVLKYCNEDKENSKITIRKTKLSIWHWIESRDGKTTINPILYCPYCGKML